MAASRIGSTASLCRRYRVFFVASILLVGFQLFLAIRFYGLTDPAFDVTRESYRQRSILRQHEADDVLAKPHDALNLMTHKNSSDQQQRIKALYKHVLSKLQDLEGQINVSEPLCEVTGKDALSAVNRAPSEHCKREITKTYCDMRDRNLYPMEVPRYCPLKEDNAGEYMGCYRDNRRKRILDGNRAEFQSSNTPQVCMNHCLRLGYNYAGVEFAFECFCGELTSKAERLSDSVCDTNCAGDESLKCGGYHAINIYRTGYGTRVDNPSKYVSLDGVAPQLNKVKVVFVLTVNGRALRQIQRLLRALYDPHHYYYIHIDKRQEYLHRELTKVTANFSNIAIADKRYSSIWGGASLLTMHLACMQALLKKTEWNWDYFINLSESDFPIKDVQHLTAYLTKYKTQNFLKNHGTQTSETIPQLLAYLTHNPERNFLKSHGKDTYRFIRKQGLNMLFHECDTHMWRLGERPLQDGIRIDGGSDWFCLHRSFAEYVSFSGDKLITGIKQFWKYSLLPAESFFHTALQNSRFCGSWVNNNLHLTNWRRKQGCKCQYKHIVDWCGCSPNDFMPTDISKIKNALGKPIYFARKFEAIINQAIINELEASLFGSYPRDTPGLANYWQSEYHHLDVETPTADHQMTAYHAFTRLSAAHLSATCDLLVSDLLEVTFFNQADLFMGLLVKHSVKSRSGESTVESLIQVLRPYKVIKVVGPVKRLKFMEVGSNFDPKEEVFRNFGSILGPQSEVKLKMNWGPGEETSLSLIYLDPAGVIAGFFEVPVPESDADSIQTHSPPFFQPLRPGVWTVRALYLWNTVAETEFLVLPLAYLSGKPIALDSRGVNAGPVNGSYASKSFNQLRSTLGMDSNQLNSLKVTAEANALKSGQELIDWVDSLVLNKWKVSESCLINGRDRCLDLALCSLTKWSTLSPDPKSEFRAEQLILSRLS